MQEKNCCYIECKMDFASGIYRTIARGSPLIVCLLIGSLIRNVAWKYSTTSKIPFEAALYQVIHLTEFAAKFSNLSNYKFDILSDINMDFSNKSKEH